MGGKSNNPQRRIIHLDLDAFFASVEQLDRPELRGKPVLVGGDANRGVVCAASYEARKYGVKSAMPMVKAVRLCPQAQVLPVRRGRYQELSEAVFAVFHRYTDRVEALSIDEAFLDVTGCERLFGTATEIAHRIRRDVTEETGLVISAGVAPNKFLAKLASEAGKPNGLVEVTSEGVEAFLHPLAVGRLWGVGPVAAERLARVGVHTVAQALGLQRRDLVRLLGNGGERLYRLLRGEDDRPVEPHREVQSVGHEETYAADLWDLEEIGRCLLDQSEKVAYRLRKAGQAGRCVTLKVRYGDFTTLTRRKTLDEALNSGGQIHAQVMGLLRETDAGRRPVRLLGVSLSGLARPGEGQLGLFDAKGSARGGELDRAVDQLRERFGGGKVVRAVLLEGTEIRRTNPPPALRRRSVRER